MRIKKKTIVYIISKFNENKSEFINKTPNDEEIKLLHYEQSILNKLAIKKSLTLCEIAYIKMCLEQDNDVKSEEIQNSINSISSYLEEKRKTY